MAVKVALVGYGRMGKEVEKVLRERGYDVVGIVEKGTSLSPIDAADVVVEFALPDATVPTLTYAAERGKRYVFGTTGHTSEQMEEIRRLSEHTAVLYSPNFSRGIAVLRFVLREILPLLSDWDREVFEIHHRWKKDAPSGTALALARLLGGEVVVGRRGPRREGEVGVASVRGGDVFGDHTVFFLGEGERIEITHRLTSRRALALGVPPAIDFILKKDKGLYTYDDLLRAMVKGYAGGQDDTPLSTV